MLQFLRNNTKVVIWFTILLLVGVFGISSISLRREGQYAGEVFGKKVSFQEFRAFQTLTRLFPPAPQVAEDPKLENQFTWQQIILSREAKSKKFEVSDKEVQARVDQLVNLENATRISQEEYIQLLKARHTTPFEFENGVREMIRIQKMITEHFKSLSPVPAQPAAAPAAAANPKAAAKKADEDLKGKQEEYARWMGDIFERSKTLDYSRNIQNTAAS